VKAVHYVDFCGDLSRTICGKTPPDDFDWCTPYMSAATCPSCIKAVQKRMTAVRPPSARELLQGA